MDLYTPILVLGAIAAAFAVGSVGIALLIGPRRYNHSKLEAYECGIEPVPEMASAHAAGQRFPIKYYLTAMLFIIFDIEIVFLYPWAVAFDSLGTVRAGRDASVHGVGVRGLRVCVAAGRPDMGLEEKLPGGILLSTVEKVAGYVRKGSLWPATFGLACCAIEMMATAGPRFDIARFGMERFSATPRQADLMIVAGRVSQKMAPVLRQVYDQMAEPKWVLAMGVCASSGGMFNNYAIVQGVDHVVPVDIYLPGCPPRPEMLLHAILKLHAKIQEMPLGRQPRGGDRAKPSRPRWRSRRPSSSRGCCGDRDGNGNGERAPDAAARGDRRAPRHVRRRGQRRHVRLRPAGPRRSRCRAARRDPTAATSTRSSTS